jgi:hypothetical protein
MALEPAGVEFVAKGFNDFIRNIGEASKAIVSLGRMTENRLAALRELNDIMATAGDSAANFAKSVNRSTGQAAVGSNASANKILSAFTRISKGAGTLGNEIGGIFKGITKAMSIGGALGGIAGTVLGFVSGGPAGAAAMGGIAATAGAIQGAIMQLGMNIIKAVSSILPKTISAIVNAAISIGKAFIDFGKKVISTIANIIKSIGSAIGNLFKSIVGLFTGGGGGYGGWRSLGDTIFSAMFKFEILKQVIRKIIDVIKEFSRTAFDAAAELQVLTARVDNLVASQIRSIKGITDYNESMAMASAYTQNLLTWMEKLALATPVSLEDISNVTYLSLAMGWSVNSAKDLTKAIVDYTSALGMGSDIAEKIIYNFAQMKQQGKVTGT